MKRLKECQVSYKDTEVTLKMKRLKYILLIGILACTTGCQKENAEFIPIVSNEPDTVEVVEPGYTQPTQIEEDKPKETIKEETTSFSGEDDIDDYLNENLVLEDDEEIEACEWVSGFNEEQNCFRVRICYKEEPENEYKHKRDFFVFRENELTSIMVDYPSKSDYDAPRYVYDANDFAAYKEDVNFDGYNDLLIHLGCKSGGGDCWCAYLYENGNYVYNESFEKISNYKTEPACGIIYSTYTSQGTGIEKIFKYDESENEFAEICELKEKDGALFTLIAELIFYDNSEYFNEDEKDYSIVQLFGEQLDEYEEFLNKDGHPVYLYAKMPIEDLEKFYSDVYQEKRTFEVGYDTTTECGIVCKEDGFAYSANGVGWGDYCALTEIKEIDSGIKVYCDEINAFDGLCYSKISFIMAPSDNKFGYSLKRDSIKIEDKTGDDK